MYPTLPRATPWRTNEPPLMDLAPWRSMNTPRKAKKESRSKKRTKTAFQRGERCKKKTTNKHGGPLKKIEAAHQGKAFRFRLVWTDRTIVGGVGRTPCKKKQEAHSKRHRRRSSARVDELNRRGVLSCLTKRKSRQKGNHGPDDGRVISYIETPNFGMLDVLR